jgi:TetR/AcrR family transcriptional repressor of mexJK operon
LNDKSEASAPRLAPPAASRTRPVAARSATARAGRPTAERVEAINQAILSAARELFLMAGYDATPMEAVSIAAQVSKGTLYARFPTKEALLRGVVEDRIATWDAQIGLAHGPMPEDFKDRLHTMARRIIGSMASEEIWSFQRLIATSADANGEMIRALFEVGHQAVIARLVEEIRHGAKDFPAPPRSPVRVAEMLMAMLTGWYDSHRRVRAISAQEASTYADHAVDVLFAARASW